MVWKCIPRENWADKGKCRLMSPGPADVATSPTRATLPGDAERSGRAGGGPPSNAARPTKTPGDADLGNLACPARLRPLTLRRNA
jgi:hypothetical protein